MVNLLQGDCLELMKNIPDKSIDMILWDLPYGILDFQWDNIIMSNPAEADKRSFFTDGVAVFVEEKE